MYMDKKVLKEDDIILNSNRIYQWFSDWAKSLNVGFTINQIYQLYIDGKIKNDGSVLFYNFLKAFKYFELNKLYGVGKKD